MSADDSVQQFDSNDDDIYNGEIEESIYQKGSLYSRVYEMTEKCAGTYIGHYITGKIDSLLKLIEDTAKWSLPPKNKNETSTPLKRPLPWIPFIALILVLRLIRISLSMGGLFIGNRPLVPNDIVYFIQTRRRKLRAIRIAGMKEIGNKNQIEKNSQKVSFLSNIKSIISMAICRPKFTEDSEKIFLNENCIEQAGSSGLNKTRSNHNSSKNHCYEDEDASLSLSEMLDKYAGSYNEDDDSDFVPPTDVLNDADTSSSSTATNTSGAESIEEEMESTNNKPSPPNCNFNLESDSNFPIINGNNTIDNQEQNTEIKENGENLCTKLRKPKIMPKPIKDEVLPLPIQDIKQEPVDTDDHTIKNILEKSGSSENINKTNDFKISEQEKMSIIELENYCKGLKNKDIAENGKDHLRQYTEDDKKLVQQEIFVTPATSDEDLFFSPFGSPDLCGAHGFQPIPILKNNKTIQIEKKDFAENFIKAEREIELVPASSQPAKSSYNSGKPIKNKLKGKRR